MDKPRIVVIAGPTAAGKTALAVAVALEFGGEVISADSMQVYRGMDIGTAKPTPTETAGVPHHLIDVVDPDSEYTAAMFAEDARAVAADIASRGRVPVVAGGTGLYIRAMLGGIAPAPAGDPELRARLLADAELYGAEHLHARLAEVDPQSAAAVHPNNLRRVVRALEVYYSTDRPISDFHAEHAFADSPYNALKIGITRPRDQLYRAIDARVDEMVSRGLIEEVRSLAARYSTHLKPMCGLGYKEIAAFLRGDLPLEEAVRLIKRNTRHYAKRQMTWFRKDEGIRWFEPHEKKEVMAAVAAHLAG